MWREPLDWRLQGLSGRKGYLPDPRWTSLEYSIGWPFTVLLKQQIGIICSYRVSDPLAANFWCCDRPMTDKARRMVGLVIAPLLMLIGLWLCLEGMWHGKLSGGIFWVGSFGACWWPLVGLRPV